MTCFRCSIWKRTPLLSKCRPIPDDKNASTPENTRGGKIFRATVKQSFHCKIAIEHTDHRIPPVSMK